MIPTTHDIEDNSLSRYSVYSRCKRANFRSKIHIIGIILFFQQCFHASAISSGFVIPRSNNSGSRETDASERCTRKNGRLITVYKIVNDRKLSSINLSRYFDGGLHGDETDEPEFAFKFLEKNERKIMNSGGVQEFGRRDELHQQRSKYWVIIVDDEEAIRNSVGQFLFEEGYQVTACSDAQTALNICRSSHADGDQQTQSSLPDAIVADVRMPEIDGLQFLRILRSDPQLVAVPVVLLTAKSMTEDRVQGYKAGADAYLPKPFDPEELVVIVDNIIARHEALNGDNVKVDELKDDLDEIKDLLLEKGGAGPGNGWVTENVFLTPAERIVLQSLCKGLMNKEIASETYFSIRRVEQHLTSMYRKTKCSNRTELVRWAVSSGYVKI